MKKFKIKDYHQLYGGGDQTGISLLKITTTNGLLLSVRICYNEHEILKCGLKPVECIIKKNKPFNICGKKVPDGECFITKWS